MLLHTIVSQYDIFRGDVIAPNTEKPPKKKEVRSIVTDLSKYLNKTYGNFKGLNPPYTVSSRRNGQ